MFAARKVLVKNFATRKGIEAVYDRSAWVLDRKTSTFRQSS